MEYRIDTHEYLEMINRTIDLLIKKNGLSRDEILEITKNDTKKADSISYYLIDLDCMKQSYGDMSFFMSRPNASKFRDMDYFRKVYFQCQKEQAEERHKAKKERLQMWNLRVQLVVPWLALVVSIISLIFSLRE